MGSKLGAFLRVIGGGLSQQAFQAHEQQFAAEQAAGRAQDVEMRAEQRGIEQLGVKQFMASSSALASVYHKETDPAQKDKIRREVVGGIQNFDPKYQKMLTNAIIPAFLADTSKDDKQTTELTKLQSQRTKLEQMPMSKSVSKQISEIDDRIGKITAITGTTEYDPRGLEKKTKGKIQDTLMKTADRLSQLKGIKRTFKGEYLTWKTQLTEGLKKYGEKAGIRKMSKADRVKSGNYEKFKRKTFAFLNDYIRDMSGAAVSVQEAKRLTKSLQTMMDSPTGFEAKLEDVMQELEAKQARYEYWAKNGLIDDRVDDRTLRSLESEYPEEAFAGLNKAKEAISKSKNPEEAKAKALEKLRPWFEKSGYDMKLLEHL